MVLILRKFQEADIDYILEYLNDPQMHRFLSDRIPFPYAAQRAIDFVKAAKECFPLMCAIEQNGSFVGAISLMEKTDVYRANLEIGYWVARPFWGKGIATEAIRQMVNVAFDDSDIYRVYADLFAQNEASIHALEKNQFMREGYFSKGLVKRGVLQDCAVYAINRDRWEKHQDFFRNGGKQDA